jgi:hypothetical protein
MPGCLFKEGVECRCKLKPIAEYAELRRGITQLDQLSNLVSQVTRGEKATLDMDEVDKLHTQNTDQIARNVARSENERLVRQLGKNPNNCPHYNQENITPTGQG